MENLADRHEVVFENWREENNASEPYEEEDKDSAIDVMLAVENEPEENDEDRLVDSIHMVL